MQEEITRQSSKISQLEKQMKQISELSGNKVNNDQIKKMQEEHLKQLISIRAQTAKDFNRAIQNSISGGAGGASGEQVSKKQYDDLEAENKKLQQRITQLTKTLEEGGDASQGIKSGSQGTEGDSHQGEITKMYFTEQGMNQYDLNQIQVVVQLLGTKFEFCLATQEQIDSKEFKAKNPTGMYPMMEMGDMAICGAPAICKYLCRSAKKLIGDDGLAQSQIDQYVNWTHGTLMQTVEQVMLGIYGHPINDGSWKEALKQLKDLLKSVNTALTNGNGFLVGKQMTLADVVVAVALKDAFQTVFDMGYKKSIQAVDDWIKSLYSNPAFVGTFGRVYMCEKALKPVTVPDAKVEKKKEQKKEKKEEKPKEAKPEKPKGDNVANLPPTTFDLYNFKTLFVNHKDKRNKGVDTMYEMLDWEGWSFWHLHYDIYEGEGEKVHMCNNLMGGFMSRATHTSKYTFGRMAVVGEEPKLQIMGVWLMRGLELPDGLTKEHPSFEYYRSRKLDPRNNKADDKTVREWFGGEVDKKMSGLKCKNIIWHK